MKRRIGILAVLLLGLVAACHRTNPYAELIKHGRYRKGPIQVLRGDYGKYRYVISDFRKRIERQREEFTRLVQRETDLQTEEILFYNVGVDTLNQLLILRYFAPMQVNDPLYAGAQIQFVLDESGALKEIYIDRVPYE